MPSTRRTFRSSLGRPAGGERRITDSNPCEPPGWARIYQIPVAGTAYACWREGLNRPGFRDFTDRALAELEAELVAYVVCANLGIDSGDYSFGYVAGWAGGGDEAITGIRAAGSRIQRTADDIIGRRDDLAIPSATRQEVA